LRDIEAAEQAEATRKSLLAPENRKQGRIFVVDDEKSIREVISTFLTSAGYECQLFADGRDAIAALEAGGGCELLLTDLLNAPMDGATLLTRVKEQFPHIPVVVATQVHDDLVTQLCIQFGAYYLPEPFERQQLLDIVCLALEHRTVKHRRAAANTL
jgi:DNA-binding NtrC family response regulator